MAAIDLLIKAKKAKNNEFYTLYEDVKIIFENTKINNYLKDKIVYLPCDTNDSQIYKYLVDNKEKIGIKEIINTSDDYYSHIDLYKYCDVVVTNPPFTGIKRWLKFLQKLDKKYIVWFPMMGVYSYCDVIAEHTFLSFYGTYSGKIVNGENVSNLYIYTKNTYTEIDRSYNFITPDHYKSVACFIITNDMKYFNFDNFWYFEKGDILRKEEPNYKYICYDENNILVAKNWMYIPKNYTGYVYISLITYLKYYYKCKLISIDKAKVCEDGKKRPRALVYIGDENNITALPEKSSETIELF